MNVLIVEDDRQLAEMVAKALGESGFSSVVASDGADGLLRFQGGSYDTVITDVSRA